MGELFDIIIVHHSNSTFQISTIPADDNRSFNKKWKFPFSAFINGKILNIYLLLFNPILFFVCLFEITQLNVLNVSNNPQTYITVYIIILTNCIDMNELLECSTSTHGRLISQLTKLLI